MFEQLWLKLWKREKSGLLTERMRRQLRGRYTIDSEILGQLRYVSRPGIYAGNKTTYVRIYDPSLLDDSVRTASRYTDLNDKPVGLLFEGRMTRGVFDSISDFRPKTEKGVIA